MIAMTTSNSTRVKPPLAFHDWSTSALATNRKMPSSAGLGFNPSENQPRNHALPIYRRWQQF